MKTLWYLFHPNLENSRGNRVLASHIKDLPGLTFVDAYSEWPDFKIDVENEQQRLREHDLIVFQHPFYWYSSPALFKEWQDRVLDYGFAYPPSIGDQLHGKHWLSVITTGGSDWSYQAGGYNNYSMSELLRPFQQTANLCGFRWHPPFVIHSVATGEVDSGLSDDDLNREGLRLRELIQNLNLDTWHGLEPVMSPHYLGARQTT